MFLFGRSFGGLIVSHMAASPIANAMFSGVVSFVPFYRCWTDKLYNYKPLFEFLDVFHPHLVKPEEKKKRDQAYMDKWGELQTDPTIVRHFTARMAKVWIDDQATVE